MKKEDTRSAKMDTPWLAVMFTECLVVPIPDTVELADVNGTAKRSEGGGEEDGEASSPPAP